MFPSSASTAGLTLALLAQAAPVSVQPSSAEPEPASALATWQGEVPAIQKRALPVREASAKVPAAGFVFEAESDCLANPDDTHDWFIWKEREAYSDTTDRFVFRFRKPLPVEERGSSE